MGADGVPAPVGARTLRSWRRTGLVLGWAAVALFVSCVVSAVAGENRTLGYALGLAAFVCALVALSFLRRAWSDPVVAGDPLVVRARRSSQVAMNAWALSCIPNLVAVVLPEWARATSWLPVAALVVGCVAVVTFVATLVLAARWDPHAS